VTAAPGDAALRPWEALLCVLAALTGLIAMGPLLVDRLGLLGITLSEVGFVALPTVGFLQSRGIPPLASLGLTRARLGSVAGGILCGAGGFWLVALLESTVLERLMPVPEPIKESLRRLVVPGAGPRLLLLDVLALALAPALCEEALFRGLALPSLRPRLGAAGAVAVTALLFAGFHLSIYRFIPTAILGALLGAVRLGAGSLWPAIFAHATNNLLVLLLVRAGLDAPPTPNSVAGLAGLVTAVVALTVGLALVGRSQQPA
jgi:membrane protease YdiL (CAAX protease family)